ncbi:MAG: hypothetical protein LRS47_03505 [Desulfurococcales archaeon]|nr:hypothetical protein [Desulfurococcales archaeon]
MRHFDEALKKVRPSINEYMIKYYEEWFERAKQRYSKEMIAAKPTIYT